MELETLMIICAILTILTVVLVNGWLTITATRSATMKLSADLSTLNESLGEMYSQLIEGGVGMEPVNPMQALFANILQQQLSKPTVGAKVIERTPDGKFSDSS
jgi:glycine betaine/choline ABC-type transport system substrate-binding protein